MGGAQGSSLIRNREAGTCSYQMVLAFAGHMRITASHFWVPEPERREEGGGTGGAEGIQPHWPWDEMKTEFLWLGKLGTKSQWDSKGLR